MRGRGKRRAVHTDTALALLAPRAYMRCAFSSYEEGRMAGGARATSLGGLARHNGDAKLYDGMHTKCLFLAAK